MDQVNDKFSAPTQDETNAQRLARLRERAEVQAAQEFDEDAVFAKLLAEARQKQLARLSGEQVDLPLDTNGFPEDYDVIRIFRGQNKQDLNYVPLSLNGLCIKVPRDVEVILPHAFVADCLDLCIEDITIQSEGGYITRPAQRFPYQFLRKATTAEYKAFQTQQREKAQRETAIAA